MTDQQPPRDPGQSWTYPASPTEPGHHAYPPATSPPDAPRKGAAIISLALGAIPCPPCWIAAIIIAIAVLVRSKDGGAHGKGFAISALVFASLWIAFVAGHIVADIAGQADRDDRGNVIDGGVVSVTSIRVGDCLVEHADGSPQSTVKLTPCNQPHREEAYANFEIPMAEFPDQNEIDRLAEAGCLSRFEKYVGAPIDETELEFYFFRPILAPNTHTDSGVTCTVSEGRSSTGSLKNSQR
jgi:hypothetical protein